MKCLPMVLGMAFVLGACAPTLSGQLRSADGPLTASAEARVNIVSLAPDAPGAVVVPVAADGSFKTDEKLAPGPYMVEALVPGYGLSSKRVALGETKEVELTLAPLPKTVPTATHANVDADAARGAGSATLTPPSL